MIKIEELTIGQVKELKKMFACDSMVTSEKELGKHIVVLQRGWVVLGDLTKKGEEYTLTNGFVIRRWGTKNGLGELALNGKQTNTELETIPETKFHELTVIMMIKVDESKWR